VLSCGNRGKETLLVRKIGFPERERPKEPPEVLKVAI
jgi:hypothetical protein